MNAQGDHLELYREGGIARDVRRGKKYSRKKETRSNSTLHSTMSELCLNGCLDEISVDESEQYFIQNAEDLRVIKPLMLSWIVELRHHPKLHRDQQTRKGICHKISTQTIYPTAK